MVPLLEAKYSGMDYVFECDLAEAHDDLSLLTSSGNRAYRALAVGVHRIVDFTIRPDTG